MGECHGTLEANGVQCHQSWFGHYAVTLPELYELFYCPGKQEHTHVP